MRRIISTMTAIGAVVVLAAGVLVGLAGPASAGIVENLQIDKVVVGPVPAGTTFTIDYSCTGGATGSFTYNSSGSPTGENTLSAIDQGTCTVSEPNPEGAVNVSFSCSATVISPIITCGGDGKSVVFGEGAEGSATITVRDAYLPPLTVSPPQGFPGQPFTVSSTGCTDAVFGGSASVGGPVQVTAGFTPPLMGSTTAAGTTGAWSVPFTVPAGASSGPVPISATCSDSADPASYASSSFTVLAAATPLVATPSFTG